MVFFFKNWPFVHVFISGNIGQENVFDDSLEPKNAFLDYRNKTFKKSKNSDFSKRVYGLGQKLAIFPSFYFKVI